MVLEEGGWAFDVGIGRLLGFSCRTHGRRTTSSRCRRDAASMNRALIPTYSKRKRGSSSRMEWSGEWISGQVDKKGWAFG